MVNLKSKKRALLQGASTLFMLGAASAAFGQSVTTNDTAITLDNVVDAKTVVDQLNSGGTTATVNNTDVTAGNSANVSASSVSISTSSTIANAINNTASPSLQDSGAAATSTNVAIAVEQDNEAGAIAQTGVGADGTDVLLSTGTATNASLTISGTLNRASATGNTAATTISDSDFTTNGTSATLATRQQNTGEGGTDNIAVSATVNDTNINLTSMTTSGSDLAVSGNTDAAVATANSVTQQMTLDGTKLTLGTVSATANTAPTASGVDDTAGTAGSDATGEALVISRQANDYTDVLATNSASSITLNAGVTKGSALEVAGNLQDATATGSTASNTLALSGNAVGTGAAIVSTQSSDIESTVSAETTGAAGVAVTSLSAIAGDLGSSASLTDNKLQSRATGGSVTNTLTATATSITLQAPDDKTAAVISASGLTSDESLSGTVNGGYATLNDQLIVGNVSATTTAAMSVTTNGDVKNGSSVTNDRNAMTALAQGALATNATTLSVEGTFGEGTATGTNVANAAVIANIQQIDDASVTATVDATNSAAMLTDIDGVLNGSSVSTSNNRIQAAADGASSSNALAVSATTLSTASGSTATPGATLSSTTLTDNSAFSVANRQDGGSGITTAELFDPISILTQVSDNAAGSSISSTGNIQDASATSVKAVNSLTLSATSLAADGAVLNAQNTDSAVTATTTGGAAIKLDSLASGASDLGSAVSLTDNKLQSRAIGASAANSLTGTATSLTLNATNDTVAATISADGSLDTVKSAYSLLSDQVISDDVTATTAATSGTSGFSISTTGAVDNGSSINNDRNAMTAQAQGALAANTTILSVGGTLSQATEGADGVANVAVVANSQTLANGVDVTARVNTSGDPAGPAILTKVGGTLDSSSVSTSNNKVQAFADGAAATNAMTVSATTLSTAAISADAPSSSITGTSAVADSAFAVVNRQDGGNGKIAAELNDPITVRTEIVGDATASSIASTGNIQDAFATSNKATNSLSLSATTLTGDAALVNAQNSDAKVSSLIGATSATAGEPGGDAGTVMDFNGAISGSSVAVTGNAVRGSAISNVGNNTLTVAATTLTGDGLAIQAIAGSDSTTTTADFSLGNSQTLDADATSNTQIYASFGVDQAFDETMENSQVSVSNNVQFGEALGNSATNKVQLTALGAGTSGTDPTAALNNVQSGSGAIIDSTSEMSLYSNIASSGSSIAINGNSNTALAAVNNANNTMAISGTMVDGSNSAASVDVYDNTTTADYALNNRQSASGTLNSTAYTNAFNQDVTDTNQSEATATSGILNGSATLSKNATTAEASANRVANSLAVSATNNGATAAIGNEQSSNTIVNAVASSSVYSLKLEASNDAEFGPDYAASGSSVAVEGNTTTALARGNSASNALNYTVGVSYSGSEVAPTVSGTYAANAGALILNSQSNMGNVAAAASNVNYSLALNDGVTGSALNSTATIGNNATTAVAYGNSVNNSLTMATFGAGIPSSAIANNQVNSGAVTATATGVAFAMTPTGTASGSAFRNSGNTVTAQAVGNSSVSTIGGGAM